MCGNTESTASSEDSAVKIIVTRGRGGHDDERYGEDSVTIGISKSIASEQGFTLLATANELWNVGFNYLSKNVLGSTEQRFG